MEKNQNNKHQRTTEEVLLSFFPNIDRVALRKILQDEVSSPLRKRKSINDDALYETAKKLQTNTFYTDKENEKLDKMFAEKEQRYKNNVKKAVTTVGLPNPMKLQLKPEIPSFFKYNIKKIYSITGRTGFYIANRLRLSSLKKDDTVFTLFITGSEDTYYSFKMIKNFCGESEDRKSIFVYVVPKTETEITYNYKNRKDVIIEKYTGDMRNLDSERFFFNTDSSNPNEYTCDLVQYYKFISKYIVSFSLFGYSGLKGPKGDKQELERNLKFLMRYHKEPFILIKNDLYPEEKSVMTISNVEQKKISWLFVFDKINYNCFNCYNSFAKLVNFKDDKISVLTLLSPGITEDDIKPKITKELNQKGVTNFSYSCQDYTNEAGMIVKKKVNFGDDNYDFIVIYNSYNNSEVTRGSYEKQSSANYQILSECLGNICVHNGL